MKPANASRISEHIRSAVEIILEEIAGRRKATKPRGDYSLQGAAEYLELSTKTVSQLMKRFPKLLPRSKAVRVVRIPAKYVEAFYERTC